MRKNRSRYLSFDALERKLALDGAPDDGPPVGPSPVGPVNLGLPPTPPPPPTTWASTLVDTVSTAVSDVVEFVTDYTKTYVIDPIQDVSQAVVDWVNTPLAGPDPVVAPTLDVDPDSINVALEDLGTTFDDTSQPVPDNLWA